MNIFKLAYRRYILHRYAIRHGLWREVTEDLRLLQGMSSVERARLRELSTLFLHQKNIIGVNIQVTDAMRILIAAQACLPILALGIALFADWSDVIVYPNAFYVSRNETDEYGFVHHNQRLLSGEAWSRGPAILSWDEVEQDLQGLHPGHNVVIHEIAHKLDMINGRSNGMPPLHTAMPVASWTEAFSQAYESLHQSLDRHHPLWIDTYAASTPAECFAVFSEYFFSAPEILDAHAPQVYQQLRLYYRQDPLLRQA